MPVPQLLTVEQTAEILSVSPKTVRNSWRNPWELRAIRVGGGRRGALRFRAQDVHELVRSWEK